MCFHNAMGRRSLVRVALEAFPRLDDCSTVDISVREIKALTCPTKSRVIQSWTSLIKDKRQVVP
jgi:hypothetical protein